MTDIYSVSLLDLMPDSLKQDPIVVAMVKALDVEWMATAQEIKKAILYENLELLSDDILDVIAVENHVDFYDTTLPKEKKYGIIRNSDAIHRYKGTPYAIEQIASIIFENSTVSEWFDYDGEPHHFRVETEQVFFEDGELTRFNQLVESVKRKSSWFDGIVFKTKADIIKLLVKSKNFIVEYPVCNALVADDIQIPAIGLPVFMTSGQVVYASEE